jgi:ketosteroid isomerase-like protein
VTILRIRSDATGADDLDATAQPGARDWQSVRSEGYWVGSAPRKRDRVPVMSHENVEIVRLAYAAMSERDFDALARVSDSDWVFDFSRAIGPQRGIYRGHAEIAQFGAATEEAFERFELSPIEFVVGSAGQILVRHHLSAKGRSSGLELDRVPDATLLWELRDGKVIRTTLYNSRAEALAAAGLRA